MSKQGVLVNNGLEILCILLNLKNLVIQLEYPLIIFKKKLQ